MSELTPEQQKALFKPLVAHRFVKSLGQCVCGAEMSGRGNRVADHRAHLAEALAPVVAQMLADERERIAQEIEAVEWVEWALAGPDAGRDAARIARGQS